MNSLLGRGRSAWGCPVPGDVQPPDDATVSRRTEAFSTYRSALRDAKLKMLAALQEDGGVRLWDISAGIPVNRGLLDPSPNHESIGRPSYFWDHATVAVAPGGIAFIRSWVGSMRFRFTVAPWAPTKSKPFTVPAPPVSVRRGFGVCPMPLRLGPTSQFNSPPRSWC